MATTWIKALHRANSGSISAAIKSTIEYAANNDKTLGSELIAAYECDPMTAQSEFLLSKRQYEQRTGRNQGKHDVIGYQIRQSFKPGEVTSQQVLDIGYELAMRWTRGKHQFIVAAHTNTDNPHTHIFFNSVTLDHSRKFQDFKRSAIALRRVSDMLCVEHGLSIIEKPGLSKGYNRAEYLGDRKPPTGREKLQDIIDNVLCVGTSFPDFLVALRKAGCEVKIGKQPPIKPPGSKKFFRLDTLHADYSEEAIRERLSGRRDVAPRKKSDDDSERKAAEYMAAVNNQNRPSLLFDIQAKIAEGAGDAYVHWMKIFNLKSAARTLIFLKENGIDSYDELKEKSAAASAEYHPLSSRLKEIGDQQKLIKELEYQIGHYGKTRAVYAAYKKSGLDRAFYDANVGDILLHKAAKKYFNEHNHKGKLPSINTLKAEWGELEKERRQLFPKYKSEKEKYMPLCTAKANADVMLFGTRETPQRTHNRDTR